jgi:hypothetical protein
LRKGKLPELEQPAASPHKTILDTNFFMSLSFDELGQVIRITTCGFNTKSIHHYSRPS